VRIGVGASVALTTAAFALVAAVTAAGAHATTGASGGSAALQALARGTIVAVPLAVGLYAWRRPAHARYGRLLVAFTGVWLLAAMSSSSSSAVYSVGRVAGWIAEFALAYAFLAFPTGRLEARADRMLIGAIAAIIVLLYLPTALLVHTYPAPSPWSACVAHCPSNAFMVAEHQPAVIASVVTPLRDLLIVVLAMAVAVRLGFKARGANALMRRAVLPVLAVAGARMLVLGAALISRRVNPEWVGTSVFVWMLPLLVPVIALAFLAGLMRWQTFVMTAVAQVNAKLRDKPGPIQVRELLADAFEDPELNIASWSGRRKRWTDAGGMPLAPLPPGDGRRLTEVGSPHGPAVAIAHDAALGDDPAFVETAATAASVAFETDRVADRTARMVQELKASRARILAAADDERRRIERDLHDGAQQRLVALMIHLGLAAEEVEHEHPEEAADLRGLADEVVEALDEMRSLTREIYPSTLTDHGLASAVRSAARRSPVAVTFDENGLGEYPLEIASAVYFCCVEALQNVAKHARAATSVRVELRERDSVLYFSVSDDGPGFVDATARVGAGLVNMEDRVTTVGGKLSIRSRSLGGTTVSGRIPISASSRLSGGDGEVHAPGRSRRTRRRDRTET
jgi:signal transduction histidine kinase